MITLHQSKPAFGLPSISPYSIKLELFLKATNLDYEISTKATGAPKGKTPYIEYQGEAIGDSALIMQRLTEDFNITLDKHLSEKQKALGNMVCKALEEGYYFCGLYTDWKITKNWLVYRDEFLAEVPKIFRVPIAGFFRRILLKSLYYQGMGRHSPEEVENIGLSYLRSLHTLLSDNDYLLGQQFSSYDCTVYGFLARLLRTPWNTGLSDYARAQAVFKNYCQKIETIY